MPSHHNASINLPKHTRSSSPPPSCELRIVNYFLDHLGEDHSFIAKGQSVKKHPIIEQLLQKSMESQVGKNAPVRLLLRYIQDKDFLHGTAQIEDKVCMILFFEKSISGIIASVSPETGKTDIYRLRGTIIPQEG